MHRYCPTRDGLLIHQRRLDGPPAEPCKCALAKLPTYRIRTKDPTPKFTRVEANDHASEPTEIVCRSRYLCREPDMDKVQVPDAFAGLTLRKGFCFILSL
jgi:hypothetical protein